MWCTTFAFQPWHSAIDFRRYLLHFCAHDRRVQPVAGNHAHCLQPVRLDGAPAAQMARPARRAV
nr:oleate hydratase [Paraburkholderia xenovorans]